MFINNGWSVIQKDNGYLVTDPKGVTCISPHVRVISPVTFIIDHPTIVPMVVDTDYCIALGKFYRGNLESLGKKHASIFNRPFDTRTKTRDVMIKTHRCQQPIKEDT